VSDVDDFDYLPDGLWPSGEDPYSGYAPPGGRPQTAGQQDYAFARMNGAPVRRLADGPRAPGNPPPNAGSAPYPPADSGPMPAYRQPNGRGALGYPRPDSGPMPAYRPDGAPMPAYRPPNGTPPRGYPPSSGPMPAYRADSGPMPAYRPPHGTRTRGYPPDSGPMPAYRPDSGPAPTYPPPNGTPTRGYPRNSGPMSTLLSDSGPMSAYRPSSTRSASGYSRPHGKQLLGWLPFGNRLMLLPKDLPLDGEEELREHRDVNGGWLRPAVFGAMDGLVTNSSLIAGVGAGGGAHGAIVLTGIAGLIAGAFSMATGEFISVKSQNELTEAEVELERRQHARDPVGKRKRLTQIFMDKGVSPNLAEAVVRQISADPDRAVAAHAREDLGIDPDDLPSPRTAAGASFASFIVGALIPISPFLVGYPVLKAALVISGLAAFVGGAAVAKLTGRSMLMGGVRQLTAAALATGMAFGIGHLISGHIVS
jgi:vacuolar iron transporter family protein